MPYITPKDRFQYRHIVEEIKKLKEIPDKGGLEYLIFSLMKKYISTREQRYSELHNTCYAAQHCCDEFRRLYLDIRENLAREQNGDV